MVIDSKNWHFLLGEDGYHMWINNNEINSYKDLPAVIFSNGTQAWYDDDIYHRDNDLPAYVDEAHGIFIWMKQGLIHRENGPANVIDNGISREEEFWINGNKLRKIVY